MIKRQWFRPGKKIAIADQIAVRLGLPERHRRRAGELYYEAFRQKFEPVMGSPEHGVAILEKSLIPEQAIVALHQDQLVGVSGLQYGGRCFVDARVSAFVHEFGWVWGLFKFAQFVLFFAQRERKGEIIIDGFVVRASMRGKGIGTRLLEAVFDFAQANGFEAVSLQVVDTNPGARRLYERMGFVPTKTRNYPYLRSVMGFSSVTTMVKEIISLSFGGSGSIEDRWSG